MIDSEILQYGALAVGLFIIFMILRNRGKKAAVSVPPVTGQHDWSTVVLTELWPHPLGPPLVQFREADAPFIWAEQAAKSYVQATQRTWDLFKEAYTLPMDMPVPARVIYLDPYIEPSFVMTGDDVVRVKPAQNDNQTRWDARDRQSWLAYLSAAARKLRHGLAAGTKPGDAEAAEIVRKYRWLHPA